MIKQEFVRSKERSPTLFWWKHKTKPPLHTPCTTEKIQLETPIKSYLLSWFKINSKWGRLHVHSLSVISPPWTPGMPVIISANKIIESRTCRLIIVSLYLIRRVRMTLKTDVLNFMLWLAVMAKKPFLHYSMSQMCLISKSNYVQAYFWFFRLQTSKGKTFNYTSAVAWRFLNCALAIFIV